MVAPIKHCRDLADIDVETLCEMMNTVKDLMAAMRVLYKPHGFNVGFNVGEAAGAGIEEHLHLHVVPRWHADSNMMTVIGDSRVIPEDLDRTFEKMVEALQCNHSEILVSNEDIGSHFEKANAAITKIEISQTKS